MAPRTAASGQGSANAASSGSKASAAHELQLFKAQVNGEIGMLNVKMSALETKIDSEVKTMLAEFRVAESAREVQYNTLSTKIGSLPGKWTYWGSIGALFLGIITVLTSAWAVFDTGAGISGAVADKVLDQKSDAQKIQSKLDQLIKDQRHDITSAGQGSGKPEQVRGPTRAKPDAK